MKKFELLKALFNKDIPTAVLGVGGFLLGLFFLLSWSKGSTYIEFQRLSTGKPETFLWCLLVSAQVGMWFILTTGLAQPLRAYCNIFRLRRRTFLCVIFSVLIMFLILLLVRHYPSAAETLVCRHD